MIPLRDSQPSYSTPVVTAGLIVANVLVFLHQVSLDDFSLNHFIRAYGIVPARFEFPSLLTSMFLHGGWLHLIGNMWFLWIYGDNVEDILGGVRYLAFYLLCGVAAGLTHVLTNAASPVPTIGASGAVAGVMGAYLVKFPHSRIVTLIPVFFLLTTVEIPAVLILAYWFLIQIVSGMAAAGQMASAQGGVAWFAHVGGFVAGMVLISLMRTRERYRRRRDLRW
jgi:membrane associated rhomboid family serine protease